MRKDTTTLELENDHSVIREVRSEPLISNSVLFDIIGPQLGGGKPTYVFQDFTRKGRAYLPIIFKQIFGFEFSRKCY